MERLFEYVSNHPLLAGGLVAMAAVVIGYEVRQRLKGGQAVGPLQAVGMINDGAVVVDVRPAGQYDKGHVLDARNAPLSELDAHTASLEKFKDTPVIVYCENGTTSTRAVATLRSKGFARVMNLRGGLGAWRQENLPVVKGGKARGRK